MLKVVMAKFTEIGEHDTLRTNAPMGRIGTLGKSIKRSTWGIRRSQIKVTRDRR